MEIEKMKEILELMQSMGVQGFEIGDLKVSFWNPIQRTSMEVERERISDEDLLDDDLGLERLEF